MVKAGFGMVKGNVWWVWLGYSHYWPCNYLFGCWHPCVEFTRHLVIIDVSWCGWGEKWIYKTRILMTSNFNPPNKVDFNDSDNGWPPHQASMVLHKYSRRVSSCPLDVLTQILGKYLLLLCSSCFHFCLRYVNNSFEGMIWKMSSLISLTFSPSWPAWQADLSPAVMALLRETSILFLFFILTFRPNTKFYTQN